MSDVDDLDLSALNDDLPAPDTSAVQVPERLTPTTLGGLTIQQVAEREPYINMIVFGNPGVGKTLLCGSSHEIEEMAPVLLIDIEGGSFSLREKYADIDVVRLHTWEDVQKLYSDLYDDMHGYKTIIVDSLTEVQKFSMGQIMRQLIQEDPSRDPDIPGMREWGKNIEQIRRFVRAFRDLPCNTLFTALVREDRNPRTGMVTKLPSLSGKLAAEVAGFVDIVLFMYVKAVDEIPDARLLLAKQTEDTVAKDRSNKLPMVLGPNPSMRDIHKHIFG